ncbi:hypothetical protein COT47_04895, partial [Candidatus Woesearchaeota archaeon CG08_land_8_20_14_0_20_43_7]
MSCEFGVLSEEFLEQLNSLTKWKLDSLSKAVRTVIRRKYKDKKWQSKYGNMNKGFTESELKCFLSACKHPKAHLAFSLMAHLGLRVSEACAIRTFDIDWVKNKVRISTLKANTGDFQHLTPRVRTLLADWVRIHAKRIEESDGYVLYSDNPTSKRLNISPNWLRNEFRMVCHICNLNEWYDHADDTRNPRIDGKRRLHRLTTHSLRHYFVTKCYNHTKNPMVTQKLARHRNFRSTQTYINVDLEKLGQVVQDVFAPESEKQKDDMI